jgi:hypothetical protein
MHLPGGHADAALARRSQIIVSRLSHQPAIKGGRDGQ